MAFSGLARFVGYFVSSDLYKYDFPPEARRQARIEAKRDIGRAGALNDEMVEFVRSCPPVSAGGMNYEEMIATLAKGLLDNSASQTLVAVMLAEAITRLAKVEKP